MWQQLDTAQRRRLTLLLALALLYGCVLGAQFYVARLTNALGGSAATAGLLIALSLLPVLIIALCGKTIAKRWSPRQLLRAGLACHAMQLLLFALVPSLAALIPAMILGGFGYGLCFSRLLTTTTEMVPKSFYTQGIAYLTLTVQMGVGLSSMMAAIVEPLFGIHGVFWLPFLLALAALPLTSSAAGNTAAAAADNVKASKPGRLNVLEVALLMSVLGLTFGLPLQFVPMWLAQSPTMNFSPAYFLSTSFFTIMATRLAFSHCLNGRREFHVVLVCFAAVSLAIAVLGGAHTPWQFAACAVAYGASYSLLYPSCIAYLLQQVGPEERGPWSNWVLLAYETGSRCLPAVFGMVADHGGFPLTFRLTAALIAVTGGWHILKRLRQSQTAGAALSTG